MSGLSPIRICICNNSRLCYDIESFRLLLKGKLFCRDNALYLAFGHGCVYKDLKKINGPIRNFWSKKDIKESSASLEIILRMWLRKRQHWGCSGMGRACQHQGPEKKREFLKQRSRAQNKDMGKCWRNIVSIHRLWFLPCSHTDLCYLYDFWVTTPWCSTQQEFIRNLLSQIEFLWYQRIPQERRTMRWEIQYCETWQALLQMCPKIPTT